MSALRLAAPAVTALLVAGLAPPAAAYDGSQDGFTYGDHANNTYTYQYCTGYSPPLCMYYQNVFAMHRIGYGPTAPTAGKPFYLHLTASNVAAGDQYTSAVMLELGGDPGLSLRYSPTAEMPAICRTGSFEDTNVPTPFPCPTPVDGGGGFLRLTGMVGVPPGSMVEVFVPVVAAQGTGRAYLRASWFGGNGFTPAVRQVIPAVEFTVGAGTNNGGAVGQTYPLKKTYLRYKSIRSTTPAVCRIQGTGMKRVLKVTGTGRCTLVLRKKPGAKPKKFSKVF